MIGSCFTEHIGNWLSDRKFKIELNPFGISYNPISIANQIDMAFYDKPWDREAIVEFESKFYHYETHSSVSSDNREALLREIDSRRIRLKDKLSEANFLFVTFGTSFAFRRVQNGKIVNNCHRQLETIFNRELLNVGQMVETWNAIIAELLIQNPKIQIVFTVSPIRHLRHGAIDNQRSKARLILLCEALENQFDRVSYLPIYEMVMDELRDYRYYRTDDMIHINDLGLALISERFREILIAKGAWNLLGDIEDWLRMTNHRIDNPESEASIKFLAQLEAKRSALSAQLPDRF